MKKVILGLIIGIVISTGTIYAKQINDTIEIAYNNIKISVFGQECIPKDTDGNIVEPFIYEGTTFFDDFAENNYTEMKKVLSEPFSQYDISNGVYGMKSATLSGIEYIEESSDWSTDTLIFNCTFDNVEFTPNASNNNGNNKGACYILVHKDRDTYTISNFVSGL